MGDHGVGKTSLIRRFVLDEFDDRYLTTLGTKVSKREILLPELAPPRGVVLDLLVWDIMGQGAFRELLRESYFYAARGVLAVLDVTRRETLESLGGWVNAVEHVVGKVPWVLAANKADLLGQAAFDPRDASDAAKAVRADIFPTSAKTGANVDAAFRHLSAKIAAHPIPRQVFPVRNGGMELRGAKADG